MKWWNHSIDKIEKEPIISKDRTNKYYLHLFLNKKQITKEYTNEYIALDPGVRSFQTYYTSNNNYGNIGDNFIKDKINKLKSIIAKIKNKKKNKNIKKRIYLLITKINNVTNDYQNKIVKKW